MDYTRLLYGLNCEKYNRLCVGTAHPVTQGTSYKQYEYVPTAAVYIRC